MKLLRNPIVMVLLVVVALALGFWVLWPILTGRAGENEVEGRANGDSGQH